MAFVLVLGLGVLGPGAGGLGTHARADKPPTPKEMQAARRHFEQGQIAYDLGDYGKAIGEWKLAYRLVPRPALLFNLGQAARLGGDCQQALRYYRSYLRLDANADRGQVEPLMRQAEACAAAQQPEQPSAVSVETSTGGDQRRPGRWMRGSGYDLIGGGAALVATGVYFGFSASQKSSDVEEACAVSGGCEWADVEDQDASGRRAETLQWALSGAGAAAIAGGAVFLVLGSRHADGAKVTMAPAPGGAAVKLAWDW